MQFGIAETSIKKYIDIDVGHKKNSVTFITILKLLNPI